MRPPAYGVFAAEAVKTVSEVRPEYSKSRVSCCVEKSIRASRSGRMRAWSDTDATDGRGCAELQSPPARVTK